MKKQNFPPLYNDLFLKDLALFLSVAKRASFSAAANELGVSAAHASKRIAALEAQLGCRLFNRTTRRVSITLDGEAMLVRASGILANIDDMLLAAIDTQREPSGLLRISTSQRLGRYHVAPILALMRSSYPRLEVWLELMDRRSDLEGEKFDIDLRVGAVKEQHLIAHRVVETQRILCAAPDYLARRGEPQTLAQLVQHDCVLFRDRDQSVGIWRLNGPDGPESVSVSGPMASNNSDIVREWAHEGFGVILASEWDIASSVEDGRLRRILPCHAHPADVYAVTTVRAAQSSKIKVCLEFLHEQLNRGPYALRRLPAQ